MSEIDWSKAPNDATHCMPGDGMFSKNTWLKLGASKWSEYRNFFGSWEPVNILASEESLIYKRPNCNQWKGEGTPPAGTICEIYNNQCCEWYDCKVIAIIDGKMWFESRYVDHVMPAYVLTLRPVRTPEQIAAEERAKELDFMARCIAHSNKHHNPTESDMQAACHLHHVGYRKP